MCSLLRLLVPIFLVGCTTHLNQGARADVWIRDDLPRGVNGTHSPKTGCISIRYGLDQRETTRVAMHEFVHACENNPRMRPREVLRLYATKEWNAMRSDLEPIE